MSSCLLCHWFDYLMTFCLDNSKYIILMVLVLLQGITVTSLAKVKACISQYPVQCCKIKDLVWNSIWCCTVELCLKSSLMLCWPRSGDCLKSSVMLWNFDGINKSAMWFNDELVWATLWVIWEVHLCMLMQLYQIVTISLWQFIDDHTATCMTNYKSIVTSTPHTLAAWVCMTIRMHVF